MTTLDSLRLRVDARNCNARLNKINQAYQMIAVEPTVPISSEHVQLRMHYENLLVLN